MNFLGFKISKINKNKLDSESVILKSDNSLSGGLIVSEPWGVFDGEKTEGELGRPINVVANHVALRMRAYESDLKSDLVRAISSKFFKWVVGEGLKLQANPKRFILEDYGIKNIDFNRLKKQCEERFNLLAFSKEVDFSKMKNLHDLANDCFSDSFLGGDTLVVLRVSSSGYPTCQVIDGQEVCSPSIFSELHKIAEDKGNRIIKGVEISSSGEHVAYYIKDINREHKRISAFINSNGFKFRCARLIYGRKHRINDIRGISSLSSIVEKIDKLDRFSEASVAAAEERANIVYTIEHDKYSTGENPITEKLLKNVGTGSFNGGVKEVEDPYELGAKTAKHVERTTNKQAVNLPVGSKMVSLDSEAEFSYDKFLNAVFDHLCSSLDVPPEVALQKYSSNYSASRAAINGWQHIVKIARDKFAEEFYQPFYELFFYCQTLMDKLEGSMQYISIIKDNDFFNKRFFYQC